MSLLTNATIAYRIALEEVGLLSDYHMEHMALALKNGLPPPATSAQLISEDSYETFDTTIEVWNNNGEQVLGGSAADLIPTHKVLGFSTLESEGKSYRVFATKYNDGVIQISKDMSSRNDLARKLAWRISQPVLMFIPLLLFGVWWLVSVSLRPIEQARAQVAHRQSKNLTPLTTYNLPNELIPFVKEINQLFERIKHFLTSQQHFIADAAHELRSPLTALRLQVQALQRAQNEAERHVANQRLLEGIERSTRLIEQMLLLTRQEESNDESIDSSIDLAQLARLVMSDVLALSQARHIDLGSDRMTNCIVQGQPNTLRVLLRNLLDNAIKYSPENSMVNMSVYHNSNQQPVLCIEDSGPGIAASDMSRVFDRFFRGQQEAAVVGSGLGLAIVKAIADRHGIVLQMGRSSALGGLQVELLFPLQQSQ